jgi:hypothetical protein
MMRRCGLDSTAYRYSTVADSSKHGNGLSDSIKGGEFIDKLLKKNSAPEVV